MSIIFFSSSSILSSRHKKKFFFIQSLLIRVLRTIILLSILAFLQMLCCLVFFPTLCINLSEILIFLAIWSLYACEGKITWWHENNAYSLQVSSFHRVWFQGSSQAELCSHMQRLGRKYEAVGERGEWLPWFCYTLVWGESGPKHSQMLVL